MEGSRVEVIKVDQGLARKCYKVSLKLKKRSLRDQPREIDLPNVNFVDLDPWEDPPPDSLTTIRDLK